MKRVLSTAIACALVAACTGGGEGDAGADADAGLVCAPSDAGATSTMTPPHPPHENKCTAQQIQDYAQCQGNQVTSLCSEFGAGQPAADCGACIESQISEPTWGVIVFNNGSTALFNVEGCVDDALGQVSLEIANGGAGSCGDLLHASYGCQESACSACTGTSFDSCDSAVLFAGDDASAAGVCSAANDAVTSSSLCAPLFADAGGDFASCFPDASLSGSAQQVDWLVRIVTYMCGP